jgi:hypothetical protein
MMNFLFRHKKLYRVTEGLLIIAIILSVYFLSEVWAL